MPPSWDRWAPFGTMLRRAARARPALGARLEAAGDAAGHVYAIHLHRLSRAAGEAAPEAIADALMAGTPEEMLAAAWGEVPGGAMEVLARCGAAVQPAHFYAQVRAMLRDARLGPLLRAPGRPVTGALLAHLSALRRLDGALDAIPGALPVRSLRALDWLLGQLRRAGAAPDEAWLRAHLAELTGASWPARILTLLRLHPPVAAPWPGMGALTPIETPAALGTLSAEMGTGHGSAGHAMRLIRRRAAFYRWHGAAPALVEIRDAGAGHWTLSAANGQGGDVPGERTMEAIERALAQGGIEGRFDPLASLSAG